VELSFPIKEGLSWNSNYLGAVNNGFSTGMMAEATGLNLNKPEALELIIHETLAGRIPVIVARTREDFVALIQALTLKNEPEPLPASQGALLVTGYRKRDSFIILHDGPYSGVCANMMGLSPAEWSAASLSIRLEHESTHYFIKRLFRSMRKNIIDELIADYAGVVAAWGNFRSWRLLHFMGLENFPLYREGGRLGNYITLAALSGNAFRILQAVVKKATVNLESFDAGHAHGLVDMEEKAYTLAALSCLTLEEIASENAVSLILEKNNYLKKMKLFRIRVVKYIKDPGEKEDLSAVDYKPGDRDNAGEVVAQYRRMIFNIAYAFTFDSMDAEDLTQDILIKAMENIHKFEGRSHLKTWLHSIAVFHCINYRKKKERVYTVGLDEDLFTPCACDHPERELMKKELMRNLYRAIIGLPDKLRAVIFLPAFSGLSHKEISSILDIPEGTVWSRLNRARLLLKEGLSGYLGGK